MCTEYVCMKKKIKVHLAYEINFSFYHFSRFFFARVFSSCAVPPSVLIHSFHSQYLPFLLQLQIAINNVKYIIHTTICHSFTSHSELVSLWLTQANPVRVGFHFKPIGIYDVLYGVCICCINCNLLILDYGAHTNQWRKSCNLHG